MLFRLSVIVVFLSLPVIVSLLSQQMANTVAAPPLPASSVEVRLLNEKKRPVRKAPEGEDQNGQDAPAIYTPRNVERATAPLEDSAGDPSPTTGDTRKTGSGKNTEGAP